MYIQSFKGTLKTGPSILIIAGVHGNETTPLLTLMLFLQRNMAKKLEKYYKTLTVVNGANIAAIHTGTRESKPSPKDDLNRVFSLDAPEPVATLKALIDKHNVIIDIHSSPSIPEFMLIDIDEHADGYVKWCEAAGINYAARYSSANTIKRYAINKGKVGITLELNGMVEPDNQSAIIGTNIIERLVTKYKPSFFKLCDPKVLPMVDVRTYKEGVFTFIPQLGTYVGKGVIIGYITDLSGKKVCDIISPVEGFIVEGPDTSYYVKAGSKVALIQPC